MEENAADESFQYLPLDRSLERTFRLLTLLPGPKGSQPRGTLFVATWGYGACSYEALSYVWGDSQARRPIILNGKIFEVTENLFSALSHLHFEDRPRVLWIDAICIDQDSTNERNHQVASMGEIYRNCQKVVIWLGDEDNDTESAVDFIKTTFEEIKQKAKTRPFAPGVLDHLQITFKDVYIAQLHMSPNGRRVLNKLFRPKMLAEWRRFEQILQRAWWTRAWIVQEFANAPDATFHIGDKSVDWTLISALIILLSDACKRSLASGSSDLSHFDHIAVNAAYNLLFARMNRRINFGAEGAVFEQFHSQIGFSFIILLLGQSSRKCSDPRDKIYSILSLTNASFVEALQPDYSKPARLVNIAAVRTYINISKSLDILGCPTKGSAVDYPSWCPDWSEKAEPNLAIDPDNALYNASAASEAVASFSQDDSTLYLKGFLLCSVVDDFFQESEKPFIFRNYLGFRSNWDIKLMAQKLQEVQSSIGPSQSKDDPESSIDESYQEKSFNTVATTLVAGYGRHYTPSPPVEKDIETGEWWPGGNKTQFLYDAGQRTSGRTVVLCDDGRLGLAPEKTENGDEMWVFMGASTSFVLRKLDEMVENRNVYRFIGSAYVHGVMKGEAMEDLERGRYELQTVAIR